MTIRAPLSRLLREGASDVSIARRLSTGRLSKWSSVVRLSEDYPEWVGRLGRRGVSVEARSLVADAWRISYPPRNKTSSREVCDQPRVKLSSKPGRASIPREARGRWILSVAVIAVSSALGQLFLGNGLIGFIAGWGVLLLIYLLQPKERAGD
jgi:hypothetical protein